MSTVYEVQEIIDTSIINSKSFLYTDEPHYLIKWVGYGHEFDTWQPISQLGSISSYLQYWMNNKRQKDAVSKQKKKVVYEKIQPFIDSGYGKPPKKTVREKYAEQILSRKKTWEKYIQMDEKSEELAESQTYRKSKRLRQLKQEPNYKQQNNVPSIEPQIQSPQIKLEKEKQDALKVESQNKKTKNDLRVVGSVSTSVIVKIVKIFTWKGIRCVQVQLINGRRCNMKEEEVKRCSPLMLLEFLQAQGLAF